MRSFWRSEGFWLWSLALSALILRVPRLLVEPRLCVDEGVGYFHAALRLSPLESLTLIYGDYFALWPNLAAAFAGVVGLRDAPLVFFVAGLLAQLVPIALVIHGRFAFGAQSWPRALLLLLLLGLQSTPYLWLSSFGSQFHFALATGLLLMERWDHRGREKALRIALLAVAGLTGGPSCLFVGLFGLRWLFERRALAYSLTLLATTALQAALLACFGQGELRTFEGRFQGFDPNLVPLVYTARVFLWPLLGDSLAASVSEKWFSNPVPWIGHVLVLLLAILGIALLRRAALASLLLLTSLFLCLLGCLGGLDTTKSLLMPWLGDRYFLAPRLALFGAFIAIAAAPLSWGNRGLSGLFLAACLLSAVRTYATPKDLSFDDVPPLRSQIAEVEAGSRRFLQLWPKTFFIDPRADFGRAAVEALPEAPESAPLVRIRATPLLLGRTATLTIEGPPGTRGLIHCVIGPHTSAMTIRSPSGQGSWLYIPPRQIASPDKNAGIWTEFHLPESGQLVIPYRPPRVLFGGYTTVQAAIAVPELSLSNALLLRAGTHP